jgi:hypothetical protein
MRKRFITMPSPASGQKFTTFDQPHLLGQCFHIFWGKINQIAMIINLDHLLVEGISGEFRLYLG